MQEYILEVQKRELNNKKSFINELRYNKQIPGIYYSYDSKKSIPFFVDIKILNSALKAETQIYQVSVGNKKRDVIVKSIQYHPVSEEILHIDLYGIKMDQLVTLKVPISFIGQSVGVKGGGVLNQNLTELEITCLPSDIPPNIDIDVSDLDIGDAIRLEEVKVSDKIDLIGNHDLLITSVTLPTKAVEVEQEEPEEVLDEDDEVLDETSEISKTDDEQQQEKND